MRVVMFCHSLISDWNHGNAHFLRGIASELLARGHDVRVYENKGAWSVRNLVHLYGLRALHGYRTAYPYLQSTRYEPERLDLHDVLCQADVVLVHEWNEPKLVERIGRYRAEWGNFKLFFHDTHHRAITAADEICQFDLSNYDGVLAFGAAVARLYRERRWHNQVWTWHEAADPNIFHGQASTDGEHQKLEGDLVWVGNWGDDERTEELREFLIRPVKELGLKARVYGVRYPESALEELASANIQYGGWLPNYEVPGIFAKFRMTVHIPHRPYVKALPGIPAIRVFEALACGIPLVSAYWSDAEHLFTPGTDFLVARAGRDMTRHLARLMEHPEAARELGRRGQSTVLARHTCAHRVDELLSICAQLTGASREVLV
jgi:spore maturation protein CgeB